MSRTTYTVSGRGEFPLDMLRYDECGFATQADRAAALGELVPSTHVPGQRNIDMVSESGRRPTVARWESFGWKVVMPLALINLLATGGVVLWKQG